MSITKKLASVFAGVVVALVAFGMMASSAAALTMAELDNYIAQGFTAEWIMANVGGSSNSGSGSSDCMVYGLPGVMGVQKAVNALGYEPALVVDGVAGPATQAGVMWAQQMVGAAADGAWGAMTQQAYETHVAANCEVEEETEEVEEVEESSELSGGAGSVDTYQLASGYTSEEVGEGEDDVEVAGLEIENSDGSDIMISALKVVFNEGTAGSDFDKYADSVSVWYQGDKVGEADADDFTDDNSWTQTISLDSGVIIESDATEEIILAVTGINNLDSADAGDTWTVDFTSVRFVDGQGAVISEDPSVAVTTFSFENFATATDVELKISNGDSDINDAHIIAVDATQASDNIVVFSFEMEVEGDSDVDVDDFSVEATTARSGATIYVDDLVDNLELYMDGEKVDSMAPPTDENTILFDDLDLTLNKGETYEFEIRADFLAVSGALNEGDTISFAIGETETDLATTDIDDENGDALADADITGSASSSASAVYSIYIDVELVGTPTVELLADGNGGDDDDTVTFGFVMDVTAVGGTVYVADTAAATTSADGSLTTVGADGALYRVYEDGTATADASDLLTFTTSDSQVSDSSNNVQIDEGGTSRFTLTITHTNAVTADDGIYHADFAGFGWSIDDDDVHEYVYTYDLDDFETSATYVN